MFPSYNDKEIIKLEKIVKKINLKEEEFKEKNEEFLVEKTNFFKEELKNWKEISDIIIEALALAKNACRKLAEKNHKYTKWNSELVWNMVPYDVQLIWAMILNDWKIAEMKTWEWKTLVAALALYLNALTWKWCHLVTVNEYLAERDAHEMYQLFWFLWLTVWILKHWQSPQEKRGAYSCDITYWTNNEFWFDYLRDNMATSVENMAQKELNFAIVDEVDSILIDEARTPLIISAPAEESTKKYIQYSWLVTKLEDKEHYQVDEKMKTATLTESWVSKMEQLLWIENIYTEKWFTEVHHIEQALRANFLYKKDKDYLIKDWKVLIVDEFTGRLMEWRRFWQWLHQAIEAKEKVDIQRESKTLATITFQNYFRLYSKLSWMTWTAETEAEEFWTIYKLDTIIVPTNKPLARIDMPDAIFKSANWKYQAMWRKVKELSEKWQPVLIWTVSVEKSEIISSIFSQQWIKHTVLNAKFHEKEAEIISAAGQKSAVTIATNMAWRWTDIKLWEWVKEAWWLFILWSERHESRRIDNQLRWRSWRQWDAWASQFFISMDDDLMRIFWSDKMKGLMSAMWVADDMPIENWMITRSIEGAQKKVEQHHFDMRKHVVKYDDVMNKHREIIYKKRKDILFSENISSQLKEEITKQVDRIISSHTEWVMAHEWDYEEMFNDIKSLHQESLFSRERFEKEWISQEKIKELSNEFLLDSYEIKEKEVSENIFRKTEKAIYLQTIDMLWMEHIDNMQGLREQTALAGYGQRDPLMEYKHEAFKAFKTLIEAIWRNAISTLFKTKIEVEVEMPENVANLSTNEDQIENTAFNYWAWDDLESMKKEEMEKLYSKNQMQEIAQMMKNSAIEESNEKNKDWITIIRANDDENISVKNDPKFQNIWRNDECPCGSGKKFKKCCGK